MSALDLTGLESFPRNMCVLEVGYLPCYICTVIDRIVSHRMLLRMEIEKKYGRHNKITGR
jgi:hypothetical protein